MERRLTHVLVECPELIASVRVGVLNALKPLEDTVCEVQFRETRNIGKADIQWCDVFVCVRGSEVLTEHIVSELKRLGRCVFYFLDDDLLDLPRESLSYEYFTYSGNKEAMKNILKFSDALWGANEQIKERYLPLCGAQRWILSRLPIRIHDPEPQKANSRVTKVLYAGSVDHLKIVREILAPAVQLVTEQCGDAVEFTFVGPNPDLKNNSHVRHQPFFEDYAQYRAFVEHGNFDIGLSPTKLGSFFQCKYYNKFVEYTAIGAVGVYTNSPLYTQIVQHGINGLLCKNTPEDWAAAIIRLTEDFDLRQTCYKTAVTLIQKEFTPEVVAQLILSQAPELSEYRAPEVSVENIRLLNPLVCFYLGRARYLFHRYKILAIPVMCYKAAKKILKWISKELIHLA